LTSSADGRAIARPMAVTVAAADDIPVRPDAAWTVLAVNEL
jgi:hypothetical protein